MKTYDWIVIGGGITGAALAYELISQGLSVLLVEQHAQPESATRFSYGGIAYWSGTSDLTRQLCAEGIARYPMLAEELGQDIEFRELDLVLTIAAEEDPNAIAQSYTHYAIVPTLLDRQEACALEPLLNPDAIAGALTVRHGHVHPMKAVQAYGHAFRQAGGVWQIERVKDFVRQGDRIVGVVTAQNQYVGNQVVVCAGGISRSLLQSLGVAIPLYFTHAECLETPSLDIKLRTLVMPAQTRRFELEAEASTDRMDHQWQAPNQELVPPILDVGAIQFLDGHFNIGQVSRILTTPQVTANPKQSEAQIRAGIGKVIPKLQNLPATCHSCLVAFSRDRLPLIGPVPQLEGLQVFSGFSNPFALVPPLAKRFAISAVSQPDEMIAQLSPTRFAG